MKGGLCIEKIWGQHDKKEGNNEQVKIIYTFRQSEKGLITGKRKVFSCKNMGKRVYFDHQKLMSRSTSSV